MKHGNFDSKLFRSHEELCRYAKIFITWFYTKLKHELPKSGWFHDLCKKKLGRLSFVTNTQGKNVKTSWNANEFSNSKSDLLIYGSLFNYEVPG